MVEVEGTFQYLIQGMWCLRRGEGTDLGWTGNQSGFLLGGYTRECPVKDSNVKVEMSIRNLLAAATAPRVGQKKRKGDGLGTKSSEIRSNRRSGLFSDRLIKVRKGRRRKGKTLIINRLSVGVESGEHPGRRSGQSRSSGVNSLRPVCPKGVPPNNVGGGVLASKKKKKKKKFMESD